MLDNGTLPNMDMEQQTGSKLGTIDWYQTGKGVHQGCILSPAYLTYTQRESCKMLD